MNKQGRALIYAIVMLALIILVVGGYFAFTGESVKTFCGDGICQEDSENKCSCSSDCGSCYGERECNYHSCNYENECVAEYALNNCCGNNKCEVGENSVSCSKDCGELEVINSEWEAIDKVKTRSDIVEEWENEAKRNNCGTNYLDINNAVYSVVRVTVSQNLIDCNKYSNFDVITKILDSRLSDTTKEYNSKLRICSKDLIDEYNKALRGYDTYYTFRLSENCFNCDDFYAIQFGCYDSDTDRNDIMSENDEWYRQNVRASYANVIVDAKTGAVYW